MRHQGVTILLCQVASLFLAMQACAVEPPMPITPPPATNDPISIRLAWDASPDINVIGYRLLWGTNSGSYSRDLGTSNLTATATNLWLGQTNYFVVTARNDIGLESLPSNEVAAFIPTERPPAPTLRLSIAVTPVFETSLDGETWTETGRGQAVLMLNDQGAEFVRVRLETSAVPTL